MDTGEYRDSPGIQGIFPQTTTVVCGNIPCIPDAPMSNQSASEVGCYNEFYAENNPGNLS